MALKRYKFRYVQEIEEIAETETEARMEANFTVDLPPLDLTTLQLLDVTEVE